MGCFIIPAVVTLGHYVARKKVPSWKNSMDHVWLNLMLLGGALFGFVDHVWHGEALLSGSSINDLLLGVIVTMVTIASWIMIIALRRIYAIHEKKHHA